MKFYRNLYVGETAGKSEKRIKKRLIQGKILLGIYLIVLPKNRRNQLEIFDCMMLAQKIFRGEDQFVVGIASGYDEALDLMLKITEEVYQKTGGVKIREFIEEQEGIADFGKQ